MIVGGKVSGIRSTRKLFKHLFCLTSKAQIQQNQIYLFSDFLKCCKFVKCFNESLVISKDRLAVSIDVDTLNSHNLGCQFQEQSRDVQSGSVL